MIAQGPLLLMGDFNAVSDVALDRHGCSSDCRHNLSSWLEGYDFTDVCKGTLESEYSCHLETHKTLSRIDLLLSMDGLQLISGVRYFPRALSDHSPMEVMLDRNTPRGRRHWHMNVRWLQEEFITLKCRSENDQYWKENGADTPVSNQWEAFKATMRGVFGKETKEFSKALNADLKSAELRVTEAERLYILDPSPEKYSIWQDQTRHYKILLSECTAKKTTETE